MTILPILAIIGTHTVADFVLQTREEAAKKSSDNYALATHVLKYWFALIVLGIIILTPIQAIFWAGINAILHFATDWFSSRLTTKYYKENNMEKFWAVIGYDQFCHFAALLGTYDLISRY